MSTPARLMKGRCRYCGRPMVHAVIPNRGSVMAHRTGEGELCRRLRATGRDMVSRAEKVKP